MNGVLGLIGALLIAGGATAQNVSIGLMDDFVPNGVISLVNVGLVQNGATAMTVSVGRYDGPFFSRRSGHLAGAIAINSRAKIAHGFGVALATEVMTTDAPELHYRATQTVAATCRLDHRSGWFEPFSGCGWQMSGRDGSRNVGAAWTGGVNLRGAQPGYLDVLTAQLTRAGGANVWRVAFGWKI